MNALTPLFVLVPIIVGILQLVKILTDYWTRKRLIENGVTDALADFSTSSDQKTSISKEFSNLKWGLIAFCGGLGFIAMSLFDIDYRSPLPAGIFFLSISTGFLVYYAIISQKLKQ